MNKEEKRKELLKIRRKFQASRKQFGDVFLGKSPQMINFYDRGVHEVPDGVLMLARVWEAFLDKMKGQTIVWRTFFLKTR